MPSKEVEALRKAVAAAQKIVRQPVIDLTQPEAEPPRRAEPEPPRGSQR